MAATSVDNVMKALINKIHGVITNDGEFAPTKRSTFISWCLPGLAYKPEDFDYQSKGFNAVLEAEKVAELAKSIKNAQPAGGDEEPEHPEQGVNAELLAELVKNKEVAAMLQRQNHAEAVSQQMDFIPTPQYDATGKILDHTAYSNSGDKLSSMCSAILDLSRVAKIALTEKEKTQLATIKNALYPMKKVKISKFNSTTGDMEEVEDEIVQESPMIRAYNEKMAAYGNALLAYNTKRKEAIVGKSKDAVMDFALNAEIYRNQVNAAEGAWNTGGSRKEVEGMQAYVDNLNRRNMQIWKQSMIQRMKFATLTNPQSGMSYPYTTLIPLNFAEPSAAWQKFSFYEREQTNFSKSSSLNWNAGIKVGFLGLGGSAGAHQNKYEASSGFTMSNFSIEFEMTQAIISRPWYPVEFIKSLGWTLDKVTWSTRSEKSLPLSSGGDNPKGPFIAYPVSAIFVRNVKIRWDRISSDGQSFFNNVGANGSIGYGFFGKSSASVNSTNTESNYRMDADGKGLSFDGMNLIAFINHFLDKTPNPNPAITEFE
jgi:hypothetical protein